MADEETVVEPQVPTPVTLDTKALGEAISSQVAASVKEALQNAPAREPAHREPEVAQPQDALEAVLEPYLAKGSARATLIAQLAADKADFYTMADTNELEDRIAYKDEVEKRTLTMAQAGRPLPRLDIFRHLKGEKEDEFFERRNKKRAKLEERARQEGLDHGSDGVPRQRGGEPAFVDSDHAYKLQGEGKLDTMLGDKQF